jgi:hypothetical protein
MTLEEKKEMYTKALFAWIMMDGEKDMSIHEKDCADLFTSRLILKKFEVFNIDIVLPDMLLLILNICSEGNPGQFQIILKDLLNDIKKRKGPIPAGYIIEPMDLGLCFSVDYPIIEIPHINEKYSKLWDEQKKERQHSLDTDNLCDTPEWWKEVMA